ncbi:MAG: DUF4129 domain-containing transglutaminase family protein [Phycisphaeraceae bacterium]
MNLTYQFRRLMFAQILLGVVAFCIAARSPGMLLVAGALTALSWYVTEGPAGRPLPRWVTNVAAVAALAWLLTQLWQYQAGRLAQLVVAMGHFVMWLQIVLLYREKNNREYGEILILSGVLMVAASILSVSIIYGVLLALYCALALVTALMYHLKTTSEAVRRANQQAAPADQRAALPESVVGRGHRWQFRVLATGVGVGCAVVAVLVFVLMPRREDPNFVSHQVTDSSMGRKQVGFNDQVNLGRGSGSSSGSSDAVLNFTLMEDGRNLGGPNRSFLLRGAAMDMYHPEARSWQRGSVPQQHDHTALLNPEYGDTEARPMLELAQVPEDLPMREARITLRQRDVDVLFTPYPQPVWLYSDALRRVRFSLMDQRLGVSLDASGMRYQLGVPREPLTNPRQRYAQVVEDTEGRFRSASQYWQSRPADDQYARRWTVQRGRVRRLAQSILAEHDLQRDPQAAHTPQDEAIAETLARHIREQFTYSLDNPPVDPNEDPIIKFLFEEQRGHCELFAAAHAALCRSIGLPARVVTGYLATEYNRFGGYYVVREKNAHAWTEVELGPELGWRHFDATPSAEVSAEHAPGAGWWLEARQIYDYIESTWLSWIVAYDPKTRSALLDEVKDSVAQRGEHSEHWLASLLDRFRRLPELWEFDYLTYTIGGITLAGLGLGVTILVRTLIVRRRRLAALQLTALPRQRRRDLARRLRFYIYMLEMLERHGYMRPRWQSPQAFAHELAEANPMRFDPVVALTELFYEVRFGYREVDEDRRQRIRAHLKQLEYALAETRG